MSKGIEKKLTKKKARKMLEDYLEFEFTNHLGSGKLPIKDTVVCFRMKIHSDKKAEFNQYYFRGLLKIAYDLQDAKEM